MDIQRIEITDYDGYALFDALGTDASNNSEIKLAFLEGFDGFDAMEIPTGKRLDGQGEYQLGHGLPSARSVKVGLDISTGNAMGIINYVQVAEDMMWDELPLIVRRSWYTDTGSGLFAKTLKGIVQAVAFERLDEHATLTLTILCVNPKPTLGIPDDITLT